VKHRCRAYDGDCKTAVNRRTPRPCETHASAEDSPPTPDEGVHEVTLGIYGDGPLEVRSGVVAPAGYYIAIDGAAGDQYEAAQGFPTWYGPYGAGHYMRAGSVARSFQWIPGGETPTDRANAMELALRRQSQSLKPPTREAMQERYDPGLLEGQLKKVGAKFGSHRVVVIPPL
jgi:hypothetical protein